MSAIPAAQVRPDAAAARQDLLHRVVLALFIGIPLAALAATVPVAWGWGLSWTDAGIASVMYLISGHGITIGYHRLFTCSPTTSAMACARLRCACRRRSNCGWAVCPGRTGTGG